MRMPIPAIRADRRRNASASGKPISNLLERLLNRKAPATPEIFSPAEPWPSLDLSENDKEILVKVEAPGLSEKDMRISYSEGALTIQGEKREEKEERRREMYYRETRHGSFSRRVPIGAKVDWEKAKAEFKRGVLRISLPKTAGRNVKKEIPVT